MRTEHFGRFYANYYKERVTARNIFVMTLRNDCSERPAGTARPTG